MSKVNFGHKKVKKARRHLKIRAKIKGTAKAPRLAVFRSNAHIYAQLIDDDKAITLASASDMELKSKKSADKKAVVGRKISESKEVGLLIAEKAKKLGVEAAVFDRGGFRYHGRIKSVADGAREGGLKF